MYVGKALYEQLLDSLKIGCAYYKSFVPDRIDPKVKYNDATKRLEPKEKHADEFKDGKPRHNHFLLNAEPQCGKTGVYLSIIGMIREEIEENHPQTVEINLDCDGEDVEGEEDKEEEFEFDYFKATIPYWKDLEKLKKLPTLLTTISKYFRFTGTYSYPVKNPPLLPNLTSKQKVKIEAINSKLSTRKSSHHCRLCRSTSESLELTLGDTIINFPDKEIYIETFVDRKKFDCDNDICIMTPSFERAEIARLNWNHLMLKNAEDLDSFVPFIFVAFVKRGLFESYKQQWAGTIAIASLPEEMDGIEESVDNGGVGFSRRFIQIFCSKLNIDRFFMADDTILYLKQGFLNEECELSMENISLLGLFDHIKKIGSDSYEIPTEHQKDFEPHRDTKSPQRTKICAYSGPLKNFGIIGFRKTRGCRTSFKSFFSKSHCTSFLYLNNEALVKNEVFFQPWKCWEDLHLCNDAETANLIVVKMKLFEFTKVNVKSQLRDLLHLWEESDSLENQEKIENPKTKESNKKKVLDYLKTLRISSIIPGFPMDLSNELKVSDSIKNGTILSTVDSFKRQKLSQANYTIMMSTGEAKKKGLKDENTIQDWIKRRDSSWIFNLAVLSAEKPNCNQADFVIIHIIGKRKRKSNQIPDEASDNMTLAPPSSNVVKLDEFPRFQGQRVRDLKPKVSRLGQNILLIGIQSSILSKIFVTYFINF